jgi:Rieske Fe-S protein
MEQNNIRSDTRGPAGLNRRDFVVIATATAAVAACGGMLGGCAGGSGGTGGPSGGGETSATLPPESNPTGTVDVGKPADYPRDGVYDKFALSERVYVVRQGGNLYAVRAMCTHKSCLVKPLADNEFGCPCHGSRFQSDGTVTKGPATRPLPHYAIAKAGDGRLTVDKSRRLDPTANDPSAVVSIA